MAHDERLAGYHQANIPESVPKGFNGLQCQHVLSRPIFCRQGRSYVAVWITSKIAHNINKQRTADAVHDRLRVIFQELVSVSEMSVVAYRIINWGCQFARCTRDVSVAINGTNLPGKTTISKAKYRFSLHLPVIFGHGKVIR